MDRVIFLLLCPWLLFPGNPAESHNWDKPSAPPPPVRTKTDPVSSARASLLSFPCPRGGRWREPEVDLRPTGTPASSLGSRQFFPRRSKRDGRPGRLLRIDPTESATFPPQTVRSSPRQTAAPVETSGKPSELGAEPDCRDRVDPASFP